LETASASYIYRLHAIAALQEKSFKSVQCCKNWSNRGVFTLKNDDNVL